MITRVKIVDMDRPFSYWVKTQKPEKAKAAAIKKHCGLMGISPHERELEVSIPDAVQDDTKTENEAQQVP